MRELEADERSLEVADVEPRDGGEPPEAGEGLGAVARGEQAEMLRTRQGPVVHPQLVARPEATELTQEDPDGHRSPAG